MEFKLPYEIKRKLLNEILSLNNPFNLSDDYSLPDFLLEILPLKDMASEDSRFNNAYEDAIQHTVNNDDWEFDYIFDKRFGIYNDEKLYKNFLEKTINLASENNKNLLISLIQRALKDYNFRIVQRFDVNSNIIYNIEENDENFNKADFPLNDIPFFVFDNHRDMPQAKFPCFKLVSDNWDDFGFKTTFYLEYYLSETEFHNVGGIKIMKRGEFNTPLDKRFTNLNVDYCSIFIDEDSYFKLKNIFPDRYVSILSALNDVGYFPTICENFENESGFIKSLCRDSNEAEKIIRTIRYKLNYGDVTDFFNFKFLFKPIYSEYSVDFNFDFNIKKSIPKRLYCIIGKNGVGKTLMLRDLLLKLSEKDSEKILPRVPLFGKTIVVSYSYFDSFEDIKNRLDFNFLFCGLVNAETNKPLTNDDLIIKILESINKIEEKEIVRKYHWVCNEFLDEELLKDIFSSMVYNLKEKYSFEDFYNIEIKKENISLVVNKMSSGQRALFFIITEIIANIRYNSLIIFDEPETHLHPNAITEFMNVIMELLQEFDSYGIIATHSPLIVREIFSDSIYVFEKDKVVPRVRKLEFETFGENLSTITNEIFGNRDVPKYYIKVIEELVDLGKSYELIENEIQGEIPLNLNVKILIKSLVKNRDEEPN
ncbi:AAA family ATPase [Chryseobacterium sp. CKR4-1]|uniref:AbiJ-related protein n=1 Tax=Chryseobacterium sp. CKR4-1 TaxID=3068896 RepID=UPI0027963D6D|nr:AAA family ATPase [Chryseobacterium sp. CKR4-1]MDQ1806005.1 AAA family ATPase [Chryseobacterium sp. CKR4-1]